jgi:hypothetical protein
VQGLSASCYYSQAYSFHLILGHSIISLPTRSCLEVCDEKRDLTLHSEQTFRFLLCSTKFFLRTETTNFCSFVFSFEFIRPGLSSFAAHQFYFVLKRERNLVQISHNFFTANSYKWKCLWTIKAGDMNRIQLLETRFFKKT